MQFLLQGLIAILVLFGLAGIVANIPVTEADAAMTTAKWSPAGSATGGVVLP